jgi:hypothetical protein
MKSDLYWVIDNIPQERYLYRGFTAAEILQMSSSDFNVFFPEKKIQEEREQKLNKIL